MNGFFYNLGRIAGHKAVPAIRKSKLIWDGLTGDEEQAFRAEVALGTEMASELRGAVEIIGDLPTTQALGDICQRLGARARDKRRTFRCVVFRDPSPNAITLPGGFLFFSDALLELCRRSPDQLAFVAGHEMAHVLLGHTWDRMINEAALRVASAATARIGQIGGWLRQQGMALLRRAHDAELELNADELGFRLAVAAGFNPAGAFAFLQRIQRLCADPSALGQYLGSHPAAAERSARLERILRQISQPGPVQQK
ncbi:MAG TPA: M48 family metallopeptidase [Verrucomicrobiae bacterium]